MSKRENSMSSTNITSNALWFGSIFRPLSVNRYHVLALFGIMILGLGLRLFMLGSESYWRDEIIMLNVVLDLKSLPEAFQLNRPPVYPALFYLWVNLFGTSEAAARLFSVVLGGLSIPLMYLLGRRLFTPQVGLIAAFLLTISEYQIYYSQEIRYYSLMLVMSLVMILFYIRALRTGKSWDYLAFALFSILLYFTHFHGLFQIGAIGVHYLLIWRKRPPGRNWWIVSQVIVAAVLFVPVFNMLTRSLGLAGDVPATAVTEWLTQPSWLAPLDTLLNFFIYNREYTTVSPLPALAAAAAVLVIGTILFSRSDSGRLRLAQLPQIIRSDGNALLSQKSDILLLLLCWLLLPMVVVLFVSKLMSPMYLDRYFIGSAPAFYLLIALALLSIRRIVPVVVSLAALVIALFPFLQDYYANPDKEQFREVAAFVAENKVPQDTLAFGYDTDPAYLPWVVDSFNWYYSGEESTCYLNLYENNTRLLQALKACQPGSERAWMVFIRDNPQRIADLESAIPASQIVRHAFYDVTLYSFPIPE